MDNMDNASKSNKGMIMIVIIAILVIIGIVAAIASSKNSAPADTQAPAMNAQNQNPVTGMPVASSSQPTTYTINYTDSGFVPSNLTIKVGDTVAFINKSSGGMWVASDVHPTHTEYSGTTLRQHCPDTTGTAFDQCSISAQYSFTFAKMGTWDYHNHVRAAHEGTVVVQ